MLNEKVFLFQFLVDDDEAVGCDVDYGDELYSFQQRILKIW